MRKILLPSRLTIVMSKENFNYQTSLKDYQVKLLEYFYDEYSLDEIEDILHELEANLLEDMLKLEQEGLVLVKEDFELTIKEKELWYM